MYADARRTCAELYNALVISSPNASIQYNHNIRLAKEMSSASLFRHLDLRHERSESHHESDEVMPCWNLEVTMI